jgi:hypothetical protein
MKKHPTKDSPTRQVGGSVLSANDASPKDSANTPAVATLKSLASGSESKNNQSSDSSQSVKDFRDPNMEADCFVALVQKGIKCWEEAGALLVGMVKANGVVVFRRITDRCPWLTQNLLWNFYKIGMREIYPPVLIIPTNAVISRRLAALPYDKQKEVCERGLEVLTEKGDVELKPISSLRSEQVNIAIHGTKVRTPQEQIRAHRDRKEFIAKPFTAPIPIQACPVEKDTITAGVWHVVLDLDTGRVDFYKHGGQPPICAVKVPLAPHKGKLQAHLLLMRPKPYSE